MVFKRTSTIFLSLTLLIILASPVFNHYPQSVQAQVGRFEEVSEDNCTATDFDIAGQGRYTIGGASGGAVPAGVAPNQIRCGYFAF